MRRRIAYEGLLWDRLYQIVKVEEPVEFNQIRRACGDIRPWILDQVLWEMVADRHLNCVSRWRGMILQSLTFTIGSRKRG